MADININIDIDPNSPTLKGLLDTKQNINDTDLKTVAKTIVEAINEVNAKTSTSITIDSDYFTLVGGKLGLKTAFSDKLAQQLLKVNTYPNLDTTKKCVIDGMDEIFADVNAVENEVTDIQNDLKGVTSDIETLRFQNFDLSFHSVMTSATVQTTKLIGKITIGLGTLFKSVWSLTSRPQSGVNPTMYKLDNYFHCYQINGIIDDTIHYISGGWGGDDFPINDFHGYEVYEPDENSYVIYFYSNIDTAKKAILTLDITPLKEKMKHVYNNPKKPKLDDFVILQQETNILYKKVGKLEKTVEALKDFNKMLMKALGDKNVSE